MHILEPIQTNGKPKTPRISESATGGEETSEDEIEMPPAKKSRQEKK